MYQHLTEIAPLLCGELRRAFDAEGHETLAAQVEHLLLQSWSHDPEVDAIMVRVRGGRQMNSVERNIIGVKFGRSVSLQTLDGIVVVDVDNFERISGIEIIGRPTLLAEFRANVL